MKFLFVNKSGTIWSGTTTADKDYFWNTETGEVTVGTHGRDRRGSTTYTKSPALNAEQVKEAMKQHETN